MKIYTRTGDDGTTGLIGGKRVKKCDPRVEACGAIDELNAAIGVALAACRFDEIRDVLTPIQRRLFDIGALLAAPESDTHAQSSRSEELEQAIDHMDKMLPELKHFILPGGSQASAGLHLARAICRRAERACVGLDRDDKVDPQVIVYLNRLSDLLFVMARRANQLEGVEDVLWLPTHHT